MPHIWIIEDNAAFRRGTERALTMKPHAHEVRAFMSCEDAIEALHCPHLPDVILLDVGLPGMDGIEGITHLKSRAPAASILILTVFEDDDKIFRAICAGASGYLLKSEPMAQVITSIDQAIAGGSPMNPRIATRVLAMFAQLAPAKKDYGLDEREQAVLKCMVAGMPRKQIAEATSLNPHTADYVTRSIYRKLHVNCATAAVSKAVAERLVEDR
ncbi:response regulator transcription factor [Prosthecobacter algae]|uniref:Response regulator transcription factor n=1 Tax=Prosthecobacter algae TaxID=1144682 RepID=A0ABP9PCV5_9BACT